MEIELIEARECLLCVLCLYIERDDYCFKCIFYTVLHTRSTSS